MKFSYFREADVKDISDAEIVKAVPLDISLVETDAPFLTPYQHRGKRNEPAFVKYVAEKIAEVKEISLEELGKAVMGNAVRLFRIEL